jgi:peptide chain release factor 1
MIAKITGPGAGEAFQHESGKHCVQRVPENDSKGRKQTSMITVGVLPIKNEAEYEPLRDQDIETTTQCGHGPGGQNQNKVASAVRMKHKITGITVFINGRDQNNNKIEARRILTVRVNDKKKAESDREYDQFRKKLMGDTGRSDKTRTYNFVRSEIIDHRLNKTTGNVKSFMKGEFSVLFEG